MAPTSTQLANRKKLAQEVRRLVEGQHLLPTQGTYLSYAPPVGDIDSPCFSCAVGSVIAAAAALTFPAMHLKAGANLIFANHGVPNGDYHSALAALLGFTFTEVVAFEAAFMGEVMVTSTGCVTHTKNEGLFDVPNFQDYRDSPWDPLVWRSRLRGSLDDVPLVQSAMEWQHKDHGGDRERILALMTLLESWETQPISYERKTEA